MNRYKMHNQEIDWTPKLGSRVKLSQSAIKIDEDMSQKHISAIEEARGIITRDMDDGTWEVIWDGNIHEETGLTFFPKKEWVEHE